MNLAPSLLARDLAPALAANSTDENPLHIAQSQIDRATALLDLPETARAFLRQPLREFHSLLSIKRDDGSVVHAELSHGNGIVMLSARRPGTPFDTGRAVIYVAVDDPDAHHDRAVAAGAEVLLPLTDMDYGSREYAVADPEGNAWCFGTYRPAPSAA